MSNQRMTIEDHIKDAVKGPGSVYAEKRVRQDRQETAKPGRFKK